MIRSGQHLALPGGWHIEPIGEWCAGLAGQVEEIVKQVVAAIEGADDRTRPGAATGSYAISYNWDASIERG
jgi:hypothetical protein